VGALRDRERLVVVIAVDVKDLAAGDEVGPEAAAEAEDLPDFVSARRRQGDERPYARYQALGLRGLATNAIFIAQDADRVAALQAGASSL